MPLDKLPRVLTIAGSDSGGGAGIQADLKTFQALGCFGMSAITVLTAQNTLGVRSVFPASPEFIADQIKAVVEDIGVDAVKLGMLYSRPIIEVVAQTISEKGLPNIVLDPVMVAKGGSRLLEEQAVEALKYSLLPLADLVTPNLPEAEALTGMSIANDSDRERAMEKLLASCRRAIIKGGHSSDPSFSRDLYGARDGERLWISRPRIETRNTHGTGCTYSAAIAALVAKGKPWSEAISGARDFLHELVLQSKSLQLGRGCGPLNHFLINEDKF